VTEAPPESDVAAGAEMTTDSSGAGHTRLHLPPWAGPLTLGLFVLRALTVDVAGIVSNDSIGYLSRSFDPLSYGFVVQGYRQAAYPVWIHIVSWSDPIVGVDTIFAVAMTQRAMLLMAIVALWGALRWWAVPLLVIITSATYVIHTDFVLTEGFLVPGCVLAGALAASVVTGSGVGARHPRASLVAVTALAVVLGATKLQYSAVLLLACSIAWLAVRDRTVGLRSALVTLSVGAVLVAGLAVAQMVENHHELGAWEPVGEQARAEWYGAWQAVFVVHPENQTKPELAEYYEGGDLYVFLHGIEAAEPDYVIRSAIIRERVADLFAAAGTSRRREQFSAFVGAIKGGRTDDLAGITSRVRGDGADALAARLTVNGLARAQGTDTLLERVNNGESTEVMTIEAVTGRLQRLLYDYRPARSWLGVGALVLALGSLAVPGRHRLYVAASTLLLVSMSAVLASAYIDNARYLVGPMTISLIGATLGGRALGLLYLEGRVAND
jgi:hypothetical protein